MRPPETLDPAVKRELEALDAALAGSGADPGLDALVAAMRDERPVPRPAFTARLDHRAAAGFPRQPRGSKRAPGRRRWNWGLAAPGLAATLLVGLLALVVVLGTPQGTDDSAESGGGSGSEAATSAPGPAAAGRAASGAADDAGESGQGASAGSSSSVAPMPLPESRQSDRRRARKVERSAALVLATRRADIATVADGIVRVTDRAGGFVRASSVRTDDTTGGEGTFDLRVPASRLQRTLAALSGLAHVRERTQDVQDITPAHASARSRLTEARAERRGLLRRLERAVTTEEADALRARLRDVNRRIASADADVRRVNTRAAFSSIAVSLVADDAAPVGGAVPGDGRWTPEDAIRDAGRVLEVAAGIALLAAAIALPLALLAVPGAIALRRSGRRRRERALDAI